MSLSREEPWERHLHFDALSRLIESCNKAIALFACRDLKGQLIQVQDLWQEREAQSIIKKQQSDGFWKYPTKSENTAEENAHPAIQKTTEYFFSVQTVEGDFRGIYDKQLRKRSTLDEF